MRTRTRVPGLQPALAIFNLWSTHTVFEHDLAALSFRNCARRVQLV
jgi:hypothetical protein